MHSAITLHNFSDVLIFQTTENIILNDGRVIPKGYVSANQMCAANNKQVREWLRIKSTKALLEAYLEDSTQYEYPLLISIEGNTDLSGTWVSYELSLNLAQWCSPRFAVWASRVLRYVIDGDYQALTPAAELAQQRIQEIWHEFRSATKQTFWFLADGIKQYYINHPRVEKYPGQNYSEVFDELNVKLFGKTSKQIKQELRITKGDLNRDNFGKDSLKRIEMVQRIAEAQLTLGRTPLDSVRLAINVMNYEIIDYKE